MVDFQKLEEEVRRLAREYPEAIYSSPKCKYTIGTVYNGPNKEGCLIGQALTNLYPELEKELKK